MSDSSGFSLNPIQQAAVEHPIDAPLKVIAGAGTGKTMAFTHRFVHILKAKEFVISRFCVTERRVKASDSSQMHN